MTGKTYKIIAAALALTIIGCNRSGDDAIPADAVATVGDKVLTHSELIQKLPSGIVPEDSAALVSLYIRKWVEQCLIEDIAVHEVDIEQIDRMTKEYRSELIMAQYRRAMAEHTEGFFAEDSLKAYFESHASNFKLERPLIRGTYLKVPDDAANLNTIRQLYKSDKPDDIDRLEKAVLGSAVHYDYFRDSWVDWEQIETRIPLDFSGENFRKVSNKQTIDFSWQGFVYLLSVSDFLPAGTTMPYEVAKPLIRERLLAQKRRAFDKQLLNDLYDEAVKEGKVHFPNSK